MVEQDLYRFSQEVFSRLMRLIQIALKQRNPQESFVQVMKIAKFMSIEKSEVKGLEMIKDIENKFEVQKSLDYRVKEVIERKFDFPNVVIGQVLLVEAHPNADKLKLCKVSTGDEELSIVCGAPNVANGQMVVIAKIGAILPNGLKIHKTRTAHGMQRTGLQVMIPG